MIPQYWEPDPDKENACRLSYDFSLSRNIYNSDDYKKCVCDSLDKTSDEKKEVCRQNEYNFCSWRQESTATNLKLSFELSLQGRDYSGVVDKLREALAVCYEHDIENYDLFVPFPKIDPKDPMAQ